MTVFLERPDWVRRLNYTGPLVGGEEWLVNLDPQELLDTAQTSTGLTDFGKDGWQEAYHRLLDSIRSEARLHTLGRLITRTDILRSLRNRLLLIEARKQQPGIAGEQITAPVLIAGPARSGTTILLELLTQDPQFRAPLSWEAACPVAPSGDIAGNYDNRQEIAQCQYDFWNDVQPEILAMHEHRADLPAECLRFMAIDFASDYWSMILQVPSYLKWKAAGQQVLPAYEWHKRVLQTLQYGTPTRRWLLKSPAHLRALSTLFKVYPDIRIIHTHRDPSKTIPSTVSITSTLRWIRTDDLDVKELAQATLFGFHMMIEQVIEQRENGAIPTNQIVDVHFLDLMRDPVVTIGRVYDQLGLDFTLEFQQRIRDYLANKPKGKFGTHEYEPEKLEIDPGELRRQFRHYMKHYGITVENGK